MALERATDAQSLMLNDAAMSWRAWRFVSKTAPGADLGGSSKHSNESFEDRSGEDFHVNSSWRWVSRSFEAGVFPDTQALHRISKENGVNIIQPGRGEHTVA